MHCNSRFQNVLSKVKDNYSWPGELILIGSLIYREPDPTSDVDLVYFMDDQDSILEIQQRLTDRQTLSLDTFQNSIYASIKFYRDGIEISLDLVPLGAYNKILDALQEKSEYLPYKLGNKPQLNAYQFGSGSKTISIAKRNICHDQTYSILSPVLIREDERIYCGIIPDKILTGYEHLTEGEKTETILSDTIALLQSQPHINQVSDTVKTVNRYRNLPPNHIRRLKRRNQQYV
mgnify:FL=1